MHRPLLLFLCLALQLAAECRYSVDATLYPSDNVLHVKATVRDDTPLLFKDIDRFPLKDTDTLNEALRNGSRSLSFEYTLRDKEAIGEAFVMLLDNWLPRTDRLCLFESNITLPKGFEALSEHESLSKEPSGENVRFHFAMQRPIDTLSLIASKDFEVRRSDYGGISVGTYFFKEHAHLSERYIEKTKAYLAMYEQMIGPYPYKSFTVVENRHQTGYSMPTFTLIGDQLIDKPYLIERSLGHEIVHQWFGNGVFNDFATGNWVEGLTTYLGDHHLKALEQSDTLYRKQTLDDFMNSVSRESDFSLIRFHHRVDRPSMSIGYGKGMFLFHMLREEMGDAAFFEAIRAFYGTYRSRYADYNDMAALFSRYAGRDLKSFFFQWLYAKGLLDLHIDKLSYDEQSRTLDFSVTQLQRQRSFEVPLDITLECADQQLERRIRLDRLEQQVSLQSACRPERLIVDGEYALLRTLGAGEKLLTIGTLEHLEGFNIIGAKKEDEALLQGLFRHAHFVADDAAIEAGNPHIHRVYVNSAPPQNYKALFDAHEGEMTLQVMPDSQSGGAVVLLEYPEGALASLIARLKYYQSYSKIAIKGHSSLFKRLSATSNGMVIPVP